MAFYDNIPINSAIPLPTKGWADVTGSSDKAKGQDAYNQVQGLGNQQYEDTTKVNQGLDTAGSNYISDLGSQNKAFQTNYAATQQPYIDQQKKLAGQSLGDRQQSQNLYSGTLAQNMNGLQGRANQNASSAMTLNQAMDPNNATAQSYRGMYNSEGQQQANQAKSLNAQLAKGGQQGGPNAQLSNAVNQSSAGQAMALARQRLNSMQNQGQVQSYVQSMNQYGKGQAAQDLSQNMAKQNQSMLGKNTANQAAGREEETGLRKGAMTTDLDMENKFYDQNRGFNDAIRQNQLNQGARNVAATNQRTGTAAGAYTGAANIYSSNQGLIGAAAPLAGAVAGGMTKNAAATPTTDQTQAAAPSAVNPYASGNMGYGVQQNMSQGKPSYTYGQGAKY